VPAPQQTTIRHLFRGGWAPDLNDVAEVKVVEAGETFMVVEVPFLAEALNVEFTMDGGTRKIGGTERVNSTTLEAGTAILGGYDYWRHGVAGSPTQKRLVAVGTKVKKDDADGTFADIITGRTAGSIPHFSQFIDVAIIANNSSDVPWSYDQTTARRLQNDPTILFAGAGLDDASAGGAYTGDTNATFEVTIKSAAASPDTYDWTKNGAGGAVDVAMDAGVAQALSDGVTVTFAAEEAHTDTDLWTITTHLVPNFAFSEVHGNRLWAAGNAASPSTLYYSKAEDHEDFEDTGSGTINIDPGDGDRITAIRSTKKDLIVWKGPYKGSMHRITGTSGDTFARETIVRGVGAAGQNSTFSFGNDLGFVALDGSIRSVAATDEFGDFKERTSMSLGLNEWLNDHVNRARLGYIQAAPLPSKDGVFFVLPIDASVTNNMALWLDGRFGNPRWSTMPRIAAECAFQVVDASNSNKPTMFIGDTAGFVRRTDKATRNIDGMGAIQAITKTPFLAYGNPQKFKQLSRASMGLSPKGNYDATFGWQNDQDPLQIQEVSQAGGDVLGPSAINPFTLDVSPLGAESYLDVFLSLESGGEFRNIQYVFSNGDLNQDIELHNFSATIRPGADSSEN
jgi:hypothetical protein